MSVFQEFENRSLSELINFYTGEPFEGPEYGFLFYEEAAFEIAKFPSGVEYLMQQLGSVTGVRFAGTLRALAFLVPSEQLAEIGEAFLDHPMPELQIAALQALSGAPTPARTERVRQMLQQDRSGTVRAACIRYLSKVDREGLLSALKKYVDDPDQFVRQEVGDQLDKIDRNEAKLLRERLLKDPDPRVRQAASEDGSVPDRPSDV